MVEKRGIPILRYNPWERYDWSEIGAVHIFRGDYETHNFIRLIHEKQIPLLLSTVFFSSHSAKKIKLLTTGTAFLRRFASGLRTDFDYVKECCEAATELLPNTEEEKQLLCHSFSLPENKCTVIPNGVENRFAKASPHLFKKKYGHDTIMLSVANLGYRRKNMLAAIQAAAQTDIPYFIIGPLYHNHYGEQCLSEIENAQNITYIGPVENSSPLLASAYAAAKLFLLPSLFETPGIASLEAALAGAEVITTPYGGPKEYFGESALYVEPHSVDSIKTAILAGWNGSPRNPGNHIAEHFLWERIGARMIEIYKRYL